jgi:hypothetical protein
MTLAGTGPGNPQSPQQDVADGGVDGTKLVHARAGLLGRPASPPRRAARVDERGRTRAAAPTPGRQPRWAERVHVALVQLSADFRERIHVTEGPDGLYREILSTAPDCPVG